MAFVVEEILQDESERSDQRTDRRVFRAIADNDGESTYTARSAPGLPEYGEEHPENGNVRARRIMARREGGSIRIFTVEVEYEQFTVEITDEDDPLLDVTKVSFQRTSFEKPFSRALWLGNLYERINESGETYLSAQDDSDVPFDIPDDNTGLKMQSVLNSASDAFSEVLTKKCHSMVMVCTRNEENPDFGTIAEWQEAVNSDEFQGAAPGTLLLEIDIGDEQTRGGVTFRPVSYIMTQSVDPTGWDIAIQDKGFRYFKELPIPGEDPGIRKVRFVDVEDGIGNPEPELLNGRGYRLDPMKPDFETGASPGILSVYRCYRPYTNRRAFADLNLGI